jgi:hypothetical protein
MGRLTQQEHGIRAGIGIISGIVFAIIGAVVNYLQRGSHEPTTWLLLFLPVLPLLAWGCSHLAKYRGYSSGVSYGLIALVLIAPGVAIPLLSHAIAGLVIVTAAIIPPLILMTLNIRPGNFRRRNDKK